MRQAYGVSVATARASIHGAYADAIEQRRNRRGPGVRVHPGQLDFETAA